MTLCTGKICNFIVKNIIFKKHYTMKYLKNMQIISFDIYFKILNSLYVSYMSLDFVSTSDLTTAVTLLTFPKSLTIVGVCIVHL